MAKQQVEPVLDFRGPWFDSKTATAYVGNKNVHAFYCWCERHFIVPRACGVARYAKADLDRAMKARKKPRVHANSIANLQTRWSRGPRVERPAGASHPSESAPPVAYAEAKP